MTPRERAYLIDNDLTELTGDILSQSERLAKIEFGVTADRLQLQDAIMAKLNKAYEEWEHVNLIQGPVKCGFLYNFQHEVQSIFSQSSPAESKPESMFKADDFYISVAESDRRVLAEREACAQIAEEKAAYYRRLEISGEYNQTITDHYMGCADGCETTAKKIRSRSNPEQGTEPLPSLTPFDPSCSTRVREAKEEAEENAKKKESEPDRIAVLHSLLGEQAETINQLLEENHAIQKQLEDVRAAIGVYRLFDDGERPNNRKA